MTQLIGSSIGTEGPDVDIYSAGRVYSKEPQSFEFPNARTHKLTMDVLAPLKPAELFSAKGLVVVITGGGSGTFYKLKSYPTMPHVPSLYDMQHARFVDTY